MGSLMSSKKNVSTEFSRNRLEHGEKQTFQKAFYIPMPCFYSEIMGNRLNWKWDLCIRRDDVDEGIHDF